MKPQLNPSEFHTCQSEGYKMSNFTQETEKFMGDDIKIRLHDETFQIIERDFDEVKASIRYLDFKLDSQLKWVIVMLGANVMFVSSIIIPVALHYIHLM